MIKLSTCQRTDMFDIKKKLYPISHCLLYLRTMIMPLEVHLCNTRTQILQNKYKEILSSCYWMLLLKWYSGIYAGEAHNTENFLKEHFSCITFHSINWCLPLTISIVYLLFKWSLFPLNICIAFVFLYEKNVI